MIVNNSTSAHGKMPSYSLWGDASYRWWFTADTSGAFSKNIALFALPLITLGVTGSEGLAGSFSAILIALQTVFGIAGGVIQDRYDRRFLMVMNGFISATILTAAWMFDLVIGLNLVALAVIALMLGLQAGLLDGASNAMLRGLVPDEVLPRAMTNNSARDSAVHLASGPTAGILMTLNRVFPLLAGAVLSILGAVTASRIKNYWKRGEAGDASERPGWRDCLGGLKWILRYPFQRRVMLIAVVSAGAGNCFLFLTVLKISNAGSQTLTAGLVNAAAALGMLIGAVSASWVIGRVPSGCIVITMVAVMASGFMVAALAPDIWIQAAAVAVALVPLPAGGAVLTSFFNVLVGKDKLGRVTAAQQLLNFGLLSMLTLIAGWAMQHWGYQAVTVSLAALMLLGMITALFTGALRTMPTPARWGEHISQWGLTVF